MVTRSGIGATLAAAVIFSTLLVANAVMISASQQEEALSAQADAESYLTTLAAALQGTLGITLLDELQNYTSSQSFSCGNATSVIQAEVDTLSVSQTAGSMRASASLSNGLNETLPDNLTSLSPFDGWQRGDLNLAFTFRIAGALPSMGVGFKTEQTHRLSLPVALGAMTMLCAEIVSDVRSSLGNATFAQCNATRVGDLVGSILASEKGKAQRMGLEVDLTYYHVPTPQQCLASVYWTVIQTDIQGPAGVFTVRVVEGVTVSLPSPNATASS